MSFDFSKLQSIKKDKNYQKGYTSIVSFKSIEDEQEKIRKRQEESKNKSKTKSSSNNNIKSISQNVLPTAKSSSVNKNNKVPSYRQTSNVSLPKASVASSQDAEKAQTISRKEIEARLEAERINKNIEKGGYTSVNESISNTLNSFQGGVQKGASGIANAVMIPVAGQLQHYSNIGKKIGLLDEDNILDKAYNKILDGSDYISEKASYRDNVNANIKNEGVKTAGNVAGTVGNMIPSIISNMAIPGSGLLVTGLSTGGNSAQETINEDRSNLGQSIVTGVIKGGVEAGTEKLTGGNILSKGSLDDFVEKTIADKVKTNIGQKIANKTYQFAGEMLEEQISDNAGYVVDKVINGKDLPSLEEWWNNAGETNKMTFLTTLALNLVGLGGSANVDNNVTPEIQSLVDETIAVSQNDPDIQAKIQDTINNIQNNEISAQNLQQNPLNNQSNLQEQQITQPENIMPQNQNMEQIDNLLPVINEENRYSNYKYIKSDNSKIDTWRKDMQQYGNNFKTSEQANNFGNIVEKIIQDKGYNIRLDSQLTDEQGNTANGRIKTLDNGEVEITLNPTSNRAGEFILTHEITHAIATNEMRNMVQDFMSKDINFANQVQELQQRYNTNDINDEVLADVSGQLFGNQEFINQLSIEKPSFFKKIYNKIIELANKITGNSNEALFIRNLRNKWEEAYRNNYNNNTETQYSIAGKQGMNNAVKADTSNIVIEQSYNKAIQMAQNNIDNETIRQQTNWFQDKNGDWKFEFSDKHMSLKSNIKLEAGKSYRLENILKHDTLFLLYPELANYEVKILSNSKANGSFNKFKKIININDKLVKNNKLIEGTLIHEIQHAIQHIEGFEHGRSSKKSKLAYYNSLGEIEATDTKNRFIQEKYKNINISNIAPESSKSNPKHRDLNKYLKNRKLLDKIKDSIYNYFNSKNGGISNEINQEIVLDNTEQNSSLVDGRRNLEQKNSNQSSFSMQESENNTQDNQGRTLSKEQQEYFKDSKVRDENGNLITVYHGTAETFTKFEKEMIGSNYNQDIQGFFFTDDIKQAENYANTTSYGTPRRNQGNVMETYLNITNPLVENIDFDPISHWDENYERLIKKANQNGNDGVIIKAQKYESMYVAFEPNQIKNVDNTNPTSNPDIRYLKDNKSWQNYLEQKFTNNGTKTYFNEAPEVQKQAPSIKNNKLATSNYMNSKVRKHYDSIIKSQYTTDEAKMISKELMGADTYVPESNKKQLETADRRIQIAGPDSELNSLMSRASTGGNIKADDIAVGERLIQYYSKTGDKTKLQEAIQATAMAGTTAGQTVQAMSLLNHQTPEGQAVWLQRSVEKMNNNLRKARGAEAEQFELTEDMIDKIVNSNNDKELHENLNQVYKELGNQVSKTTAQKIDSWRYFAMLANPRTHIRNIVGNTAMSATQSIKNKIAGSIETVAQRINPKMERTHTVLSASKEVKQFAKSDIENVADRLGLNENKYNPKTRLENSMRTFKSDTMENTVGKLFELNDKALEAEDGWGLKAGYTRALSEYMTANNLDPKTITDKQLAKARNYAVEQAKEATFHQESNLATLINQLSNKNKFSKFVMDATLPFKKTPINVAKAGLEYSPIGLVKSAVYDTVKLRKGDINVNQYIDNVSKGLTGTGIALVGYALAKCGILKASGSDDKDKEGYDEDRGNQTYSIKIGDNTYSLDWLAPTGIPLFIGAEIHEIMQASQEEKTSSSDDDTMYSQAIKTATNILDAFTNAMNPMTEMSMLSGLTSSLKSYDGDSSKMLANIGANAVKSYVNQFVPTALNQIAKTTDTYERSTTSTKTGTLPKAIDSTKNYIMSKIPGLRQTLPTKTDMWGNDIKQSDNVLQRALENAVFPWTRKEVSSNAVDNEIMQVYDNTGESSVFPDTINKNLTINKQKYLMTSEEYSKYKKQYGENSYELLSNLVKSSDYKKMTDDQKKTAIEKVYSYATEQIKIDYAKQNKLNYEESTLSETINEIKKVKGNTSNYFEYLALTKDLEKSKEKMKVLYRSNFDNNTKKAIYKNSVGKDDSTYQLIEDTNINITEYIKYKTQEFVSDKKDDGTIDGSSISGSKKKKVYAYIENMNITYSQKLLLKGMQYSLTNNEQAKLANYVKNLNISKSEKLEIYSKLKGFTVYKDGTISW